jgi:transcriptional regulator with XRE-family HTH domain
MRDRISWAEAAMPRTFAANLLRLMGNATQQEIADKVGMSRSALNKILQGRVDPRLSTVQALAEVLGQPIGALTGEEGPPEGPSPQAAEIARLYDVLDLDTQAFVWKLLRKLCETFPSSQ